VNNINVTNTRVNVTQITNVYNVYNGRGNEHITYVNQRVTNSVTVVTHDTFVNARAVNRNIVRVDAREINQAPVFHRPMEQPVRQSVFGGGAPARFQPPARVVNRQVIATRTPPPVREPLSQRPPINNVRTEQPGVPRQIENTNRPQDRSMPTAQMPHMEPRPQVGGTVPRPGQPEQTRDNNNNRDNNNRDNNNNDDRRNAVRQPQGNNDNRERPNNPGVRQAPPVQEKSAQQQQNEERKFRQWDDQRRNNPPARTENRAPEHRPEPPKEQKPAAKPPHFR
jgi:hypothetical protein